MIEAWFEVGEAIYPLLIPTEEVCAIARALGMQESDLFRIDIPAGASREARIVGLVPRSVINDLYASTSANPNAVFKWREANDSSIEPMEMNVWLLPPRPLHVRTQSIGSTDGLMIVEAVDYRWWWKQAQSNDLCENPFWGARYGSDGRWNTSVPWGPGATLPGGLPTIQAFIEAIRDALPAKGITTSADRFEIPAGFAPDADLLSRFADLRFTPECSMAMMLDIVLSGCGWTIEWEWDAGTQTSKLILVEIGDDADILGAWMAQNKRAFQGGVEASSALNPAADNLMISWNGQESWQRNRIPDRITISHPYRSVEGKTRYGNTDYGASDISLFDRQAEFGWEGAVSTVRAMNPGAQRILRESRALPASVNTTLNPGSPSGNIIAPASACGWDYIGLRGAISTLWEARTTVSFGKVMWAGWATMPIGSYRATMWRMTLVRMGNEMLPVSMTEAAEDDWILGSDGMLVNDPTQVVMGKGLVQPRRLSNGIVHIDAAPPNCRVFPAKITGFLPMTSGEQPQGNAWQWLYSFEEIEPNPDANSPMTVSVGALARVGVHTARNLIEDANVYTVAGASTNFIAPGVSQAAYTDAVIDAQPISVGSVVMMCEHFPTLYTGGQTPFTAVSQPEFWFSCPNAVAVTCIQP